VTPDDPGSRPPAPVRYRTLRLCSNGGGYEALPDRRASLDLPRYRRTLEAAGRTVIDARVMLIVQLPPEVTITRGGRFLFKTRDPERARAALAQLLDLLGLDGSLAPPQGR